MSPRAEEATPSVPEKRTNSLAFARTECHTCAQKGLVCDRRRPRCGTCLSRGWTCGGFAIPLSWDDCRTWLGQMAEEGVTHVDDAEAASSATKGNKRKKDQRAFRFVDSRSKTRKSRKTTTRSKQGPLAISPPPDSTSTSANHAEELAIATNVVSDAAIPHPAIPPNPVATEQMPPPDLRSDLVAIEEGLNHGIATQDFGTFAPDDVDITKQQDTNDDAIPLINDPENDMTNYTSNTWVDDALLMFNSSDTWQMFADAFNGNLDTHRGTHFPDWLNVDTTFVQDLSPNITLAASNDSEQIWLLDRYDSEFCVLPLTSDLAVNPFRCRQQSWRTSPLLLHAVLALCYQHMGRASDKCYRRAIDHREEALKLLEDASPREAQSTNSSVHSITSDLHLLDPILVMFTFECMISASGNWARHLNRAFKVMEGSGGPEALDTPVLRSQAGMLLWWDATLALISRQGMIIDLKYLDHILSFQASDQWSFYELTGCPDELVVHLIHLAELAKQSELAANLAWLSFDLSPVLEIRAAVETWHRDEFAQAHLTDNPTEIEGHEDAETRWQRQQDRYHCAEAWRQSLLLYIHRVFTWQRPDPPSQILKLLARKTLDHVRSCRRMFQTQKQLLLPVYLAGSEVTDEESRQFARDYCNWWATRSRYNMFSTVPVLLEQVWKGGPHALPSYLWWWGAVVDKNTGPSRNKDEDFQYLFG